MTPEPERNCRLCPRLVAFREECQANYPDWFNAPVPSFGPETATLLIVGLAPGMRGANRTGRPFTGDFAGDLLYETLDAFGFSSGRYDARPDDGLKLHDCMVTNAVRCLPPQNKPIGQEINTCREFLANRIAQLPELRVIIVLGRIAHEATVSAMGHRKSAFPFAHRARHQVSETITLLDSYHCSRYNTNTGRLTPDMFRRVFQDARACLRGDI
ncbi:MAG: uracil-DNA glycosylase [Hyphomicrobiaceae bacterium]